MNQKLQKVISTLENLFQTPNKQTNKKLMGFCACVVIIIYMAERIIINSSWRNSYGRQPQQNNDRARRNNKRDLGEDIGNEFVKPTMIVQ